MKSLRQSLSSYNTRTKEYLGGKIDDLVDTMNCRTKADAVTLVVGSAVSGILVGAPVYIGIRYIVNSL